MRVNGKTIYARNPKYVIRDAEMVLMFRDGKTLAEIGAVYGVTREYVRQQLAKMGLSSIDGGRTFRSLGRIHQKAASTKAKQDAREAKHFAKHGMTIEAMRSISPLPRSHAKHPLRAFQCQRRNAGSRGIAWNMTFAEWWRIWQESGHWADRGRGKGYCMARWADDGPYSPENVYICTIGQNFSDSYITKPAAMRAAKSAITRARNKSLAADKASPVTPSVASASLGPV